MNRRGFLGLLLSLPLLRSLKTVPVAPVALPDPMLLRDVVLAGPWQIIEQIVSYEASGGLRTVSRYVTHDQQWTYELTLQQDGTTNPQWMQEIRKRPRYRGV